MKSPLNTNAADNQIESRTHVSLGVTLAGIVTAILCVLAFLYDTYSTGSELLPRFIESSSTSGLNALVTSASTFVSTFGDALILMVNF